MSETEFTPFVPPNNQMTDFEERSVKLPPPPVREKKARKKRKAEVPAAPKAPKRRKKRTVVKDGPVAQVARAVERGEAKRRKKKQFSSRLSLAAILEIAWQLKEGDGKIFEAVIDMLRPAPKAARTRILAAVGRVFA